MSYNLNVITMLYIPYYMTLEKLFHVSEPPFLYTKGIMNRLL